MLVSLGGHEDVIKVDEESHDLYEDGYSGSDP